MRPALPLLLALYAPLALAEEPPDNPAAPGADEPVAEPTDEAVADEAEACDRLDLGGTTVDPLVDADARHGVLREQSHVIKHGATPGRADITERVNSSKSGGDVAALERRGRGSPTSTTDTERKPNLEASDVVERSETVRHLEDMPREDVERGRGGTLE